MKLRNLGIALAALAMMRVLPAGACASIADHDSRVSVVDESAIIVWDEKNQTQHFIRSATFDSTAKSIGFIVPTPSEPQLAEADLDAFAPLEQMIRPEVVIKEYSRYRPNSLLFSLMAGGGADDDAGAVTASNAAAGAATDSVQVVGTQKVGDYDATILRATDAGALNRWLRRNGYQASAAFEKWLGVYVKQGWVVTAFKVRRNDGRSVQFSSNLVRMSFKTRRPFFPYREPADHREGKEGKKRLLRVFFFASTRTEAAPGNFGTEKSWPGKITWSDNADKHRMAANNNRQWFADRIKLPEATLQQANWMTVFEDKASPRPGTDDVFFGTAPANVATLPPPVIVPRPVYKDVYIDLIVVVLVVLIGISVAVVRRR